MWTNRFSKYMKLDCNRIFTIKNTLSISKRSYKWILIKQELYAAETKTMCHAIFKQLKFRFDLFDFVCGDQSDLNCNQVSYVGTSKVVYSHRPNPPQLCFANHKNCRGR